MPELELSAWVVAVGRGEMSSHSFKKAPTMQIWARSASPVNHGPELPKPATPSVCLSGLPVGISSLSFTQSYLPAAKSGPELLHHLPGFARASFRCSPTSQWEPGVSSEGRNSLLSSAENPRTIGTA